MNEKKIFDNKISFLLYGILNIALLVVLLILLVLLLNDIYLLSRTGFVVFVGIHLFLLFFVKIHYLYVIYNEEKQKIEFHYNKRFGPRWQKRSRTVLLPVQQFDGYKVRRDSMGIAIISFYKKEKKEQYELGPFHVGILSKKKKESLAEVFGDSL